MHINEAYKHLAKLESTYFNSEKKSFLDCMNQLLKLDAIFPDLQKDSAALGSIKHLTASLFASKEGLPQAAQTKITQIFNKYHGLKPTHLKNLMQNDQPVSVLAKYKGLEAIAVDEQRYPVPVAILKNNPTPCNVFFQPVSCKLNDGQTVEVSVGLLAHFSKIIDMRLKRDSTHSFLIMKSLDLHKMDTLIAFLETAANDLIHETNALPLLWAGIDLEIQEVLNSCIRYVLSAKDEEALVLLLNILDEHKNQDIIDQIEYEISTIICKGLAQQPISQSFIEKLAYFRKNLKKPLKLSLLGEGITNDVLTHLKNFPVKELKLINKQKLTAEVFSILEEIPMLKALKLGMNMWVDDNALAKLPPQIKELSLTACKGFGRQGLENLQHSNITQLDITGCNQLTDEDMGSLPVQLEKIDFRHCKNIRETTLKRLGQMTDLRDVTLANTSISDMELSYLPSGLKALDLSGCAIGDLAASYIAQMSDLEVLFMAGSKLTDAGLRILPESLCHLSLDRCTQVTNYGVMTLLSHKKLKTLSLYDCPNITGNAVRNFLSTSIHVNWQKSQSSHLIL